MGGQISCVLQALEQQVSQEESSSQALRQEVLAKEHDVLELRTAMREVRLIAGTNALPQYGHTVFKKQTNKHLLGWVIFCID